METYYLTKLHSELARRQQSNTHYSLRAFARDLGIDASQLSKIMTGKRLLSTELAKQISTTLKLEVQESLLFVESIHRLKPTIDGIKIPLSDERYILDDESHWKVIAEWEHYAVLSLFDIPKFKPDPEEISTRLGITHDRALEVLENLSIAGLLSEDEKGNLMKSHSVVRTTEDNKSRARDASHLETLELGKVKIQLDPELRDFSSSTLAIDMSKLSEAKMVIREFRMKMAALLKEGCKTEVYQLAVQFYPLTQLQAGMKYENQ